MFDKNNYIWSSLQLGYELLQKKGYDVVAVFLQGSQNYNLDIYEENYKSDVDIKAVVSLSIDNIAAGINKISTKIDYSEGQIEIKDIRSMSEMWEKQNQTYLEILVTDFFIINPKYYSLMMKIKNMKDLIINMNKPVLIKCICGMAEEKYSTLEKDRPSIHESIEKLGYDPKQLASLLRLEDLIDNLLKKTLDFKSAIWYKNNSFRDGMIKTKMGFLSLSDARQAAEMSINNIRKIKEDYISKLDDYVDKETLSNLKNIIKEIIKHGIITQVLLEAKKE